MKEAQYGPEDIIEARLDFHYFDGEKWRGQTGTNTCKLTIAALDDLDTHKEIMKRNCWRWFLEQIQKEQIDGHPILMIAEKPIIIKEDK